MNIKFLIVTFLLIQITSFAQIEIPKASPDASVSQVIGFTNVMVEYNRPQIKGRDMLQDLTREGEVWRTGANLATRLTLSEEIYIEDQLIPKGKYSLYSIRTGDEWTLIINKEVSWGTTYNEKKDFLRIKVPTLKSKVANESHTFYFSNVTEETGVLGFAWGEYKVEFKLRVDIHNKILSKIDEVMKNEKTAVDMDFYNASSYYMKKKLDSGKALHWATVFVDKRKNNELHWHLVLKANALIYAGRKNEALPIYKLALEKAKATNKGDAIYNLSLIHI